MKILYMLNKDYINSLYLFINNKLHNCTNKIQIFINNNSVLVFDKNSKIFSIEKDLTREQRVDLRTNLMSGLRNIFPLKTIKIDDLVTSYYDQCLERYLYQRLNRFMKNEETCWFKKAQNNKCIGWIDPAIKFNQKEKNIFLKKISEKKPYYKDTSLSKNLIMNKDGFIYLSSNVTFRKDDKVLDLYHTIKERGFSNVLSSKIPIILGFSTITKRYNVICGRHRIAVLRYLRSQGKIKNIKVKCHIVKYPFKSLVYTRPFNESCKQCDWGGIYDPGKGTHQDFYMREGIAYMRGHKKRKGGLQKWEQIYPVFKDAVQNKKVLDVGAYKGLYCVKALEYGAIYTTGLEISEELTSVMEIIKKQYNYESFNVFKGDFYNKSDFNILKKSKYDTVFFFGIIHHLLRIGIQKGMLYSFDELLKKISEIANNCVIIEFAMPRESSLSLPEIKPYRDCFLKQEFEKSLKKYFPAYKSLGRCEYKSGNEYGRIMYYGKK